MKAARYYGRKDVRLEDVPEPRDPLSGEITVDVSWCGICGTDLEEYLFGPIIIPTGTPHPLTGQMAPLIMGHEVAGRVSKIGKDVTHLKEGDLVALDGLISCGKCYWCQRHQVNLCVNMASIGLMGDGGLAERLTVEAKTSIPVPANVPDELAPLAEPLSVAIRTLRRGRLMMGERVAILGAGTIGLALMQVARAGGASAVYMVDPTPFRRELAERLGATGTFEPHEGLVDELKDERGVGPDIVVDATGIPSGPAEAVRLTRSGGRAVVVGLPTEASSIDVLDMVLREIDLIGSLSHIYDEDFRQAVDLIADGRVDAASLITHRIALDDVVDQGFGALTGPQRERTLKVLVSPALFA